MTRLKPTEPQRVTQKEETETLSLRSYAIPKHQIVIWVYFLIGLKEDWLSNSKHPLFYLKIQPGEPLPVLNCFVN